MGHYPFTHCTKSILTKNPKNLVQHTYIQIIFKNVVLLKGHLCVRLHSSQLICYAGVFILTIQFKGCCVTGDIKKILTGRV